MSAVFLAAIFIALIGANSAKHIPGTAVKVAADAVSDSVIESISKGFKSYVSRRDQEIESLKAAIDQIHEEVQNITNTLLHRRDRIRLVGGSVPSEGRVEILHNGIWGTVCDDSFGAEEALVVCRSLGYSGGSTEGNSNNHPFGPGSGQIWVRNVNCNGDELSLELCDITWYTSGCSHSEDVGVSCEG